jgi:mono/diheme cytochrome c family protein
MTPARLIRLAWIPLCVLLLVACHNDMYDQQRFEVFEPSTFFPDGNSSRPLPAGTVQYGDVRTDTLYYTGRVNGAYSTEFPYPVTRAMIERGRQKYEAFCIPCHGITGNGNGMVAQRGAIQVPNLHEQRLRDAQAGYIFDIISNGIGRMYGYGDRVQIPDRWAIVAYIRVLQTSYNANINDVPPEQRGNIQP